MNAFAPAHTVQDRAASKFFNGLDALAYKRFRNR